MMPLFWSKKAKGQGHTERLNLRMDDPLLLLLLLVLLLLGLGWIHQTEPTIRAKSGKNSVKQFLDPDLNHDYHQNVIVSSSDHVSPSTDVTIH